jgi:hypothetical protein
MRTIQEFLGHADSKTTQIYSHYAPSEHEVKLVDAAFAPEPAEEPEQSGGREGSRGTSRLLQAPTGRRQRCRDPGGGSR